jgi:hypothetical protein
MDNKCMLRRTSIYLDSESLKALKRIGKKKGNLKAAQMVRLAVNEYIAREEQNKS